MDLVLLAITNIVALFVGFVFFSMLAINGERKQERWIKRAVPILREYQEVLTRQHEAPGNYVGDCRIDEVGRLLKEASEEKTVGEL
jgi:hypothetical protein